MPSHVAVAHDESLFCGFRHQLCENYKSNRELPDENLAMQLSACVTVCEALGLPAFASKVYEADDIIGTLASKLRQQKTQGDNGPPAINIISKDKDLAQLLQHEYDCLWEFSRNEKRFARDIENEFGVRPDQITDYLALAGDSVDCISGVPGVGPVKARELLARFDNLQAIYANLDSIKSLPLRGASSLASKLAQHREAAELSYQLATIVCDVCEPGEDFADVAIQDLARSAPDLDELRSFLVEFQFQSEESERIVNQAQRLLASEATA